MNNQEIKENATKTAHFDANKKPVTRSFKDSTPLLDTPEALRQRADEDGYLFFKQIVPKEIMLSLRKDILSLLQEHNWLSSAHNMMDGICDVEAIHKDLTDEDVNYNGVGVPEYIYKRILKMEAFNAVAHHPNLLSMYQTLWNETPFPHPRHICRVMMPHKGIKPTPSHQDFLHIQGAQNTWTCWMPLGDAPRELGSLSILEGSHKAGLLGVTYAQGAGGLETILCNLGYEWAAGDYEAGDCVTFNSLTVHKALPNQKKDRIRLSLDMRFQPVTDVIEDASLKPHGPFTWEELYEGWTREDLKYYWEKHNFTRVPFDESIRWQKEKIC